MKVSLILTCAGRGERAGFNKNKLLVKVNGKTCLERVYGIFRSCGLIDQVIVTSSPSDVEEIKSIVDDDVIIAEGGQTRSGSVRNALDYATGDIVLIHDGARPFVTKKIIKDCIDSTLKFGSGITAIPSSDTVCISDDDKILNYLGKDGIYLIQTPQGFFTEEIKSAYERAGSQVFNDDGSVYKEFIGEPHIVLGDIKNVKITYANDIELLKTDSFSKIGTGFDCHRLVEGRKLILGGIEIPHDKGLLGHSDADVLTHAIMDAILSACSLRDIGYHFSDKDPQFKDVNSMLLLNKVLQMAKEKGYKIKNLSAVIMAEKPKLMTTIPSITENLAKALDLDEDCVGITATTLEGLGFVGREEGICVQAVVSLQEISRT